jgi:uncharacterized protein YjiS (DUF1127 family)
MLRKVSIPSIVVGKHDAHGWAFAREWLGYWTSLVHLWIIRAHTRRALGELDEHLLRDIGLTSIEAKRESTLWFWKSGRGFDENHDVRVVTSRLNQKFPREYGRHVRASSLTNVQSASMSTMDIREYRILESTSATPKPSAWKSG